MQFAVHIRASNEGLQRFHNHGEGSYQGDLREDLKKDATLIIFTLSKMLGPRFTQLVGCPQPLVHTVLNVLNVKALIVAFNREMVISIEAFSVIVKLQSSPRFV